MYRSRPRLASVYDGASGIDQEWCKHLRPSCYSVHIATTMLDRFMSDVTSLVTSG